MDEVKAVIGLSKCVKTGKLYGIRFEPQGNDWIMTWAFPLSEKAAAGEKYDRLTISGRFFTGEEYPGCPYCGNRYFFYCCGHLNCYDGHSKTSTCQWCNWSGELGGNVDRIDIAWNI